MFTTLIIITGVIFLAMPLAIVGRTFSKVWDERQNLKLHSRVRSRLVKKGHSAAEMVSCRPVIEPQPMPPMPPLRQVVCSRLTGCGVRSHVGGGSSQSSRSLTWTGRRGSR